MRDKAKGVWSHAGRCRSTSRVRGDTLTSPSRCAALGRVEPEFVVLSGKVLTRDAMRRLRFAVHAAGWLHSMRTLLSLLLPQAPEVMVVVVTFEA